MTDPGNAGQQMNIFRFKRFDVVNRRSAMKVNTDGVLLGAVMTIRPEDRRFLDIGTGTGTIAMMTAQRMEGIRKSDESGHGNVSIEAIDIDGPSADEAASNFAASPWNDILTARHVSLKDFAAGLGRDVKYDLIFSNPPYFDNALQAPEERRNTARHTASGLSFREIIDFSVASLSSCGHLALVLPSDTETELTRYAGMSGLHLFRITRIRTVPRKSPSRIIAEFSMRRPESLEDTVLTIQNEGKYTEEYLSLTHDFYLFA